jgi:exodeoxyribonuclease-3
VVKLLAWNILHGGGARKMPEIALAIVGHTPDIVLLTEFRTTTGGQIRAILSDHGLTHQACTDPARNTNGILIASRAPLAPDPPPPGPPKGALGRLLGAAIPDLGLHILGVHIPCDGPGQDTARAWVWREVLRAARAGRDEPCMVVGDFNTGRHFVDEQGATFSHTVSLGKLASLGYSDAWRTRHPDGREPTWISHLGQGFRLDHAFVSAPLLPRLREARYSHRERESRTSDHSALIVDVD